MAQVATTVKSSRVAGEREAITIRMDSDLKSRFDALCEEFGMNINTAFNIFAKAVVRTRGIPFAIQGEKVDTTARAAFGKAFHELRRQASTLPEMTLDEINEEIAAVRAGK